jgi:hypothetical protein
VVNCVPGIPLVMASNVTGILVVGGIVVAGVLWWILSGHRARAREEAMDKLGYPRTAVR